MKCKQIHQVCISLHTNVSSVCILSTLKSPICPIITTKGNQACQVLSSLEKQSSHQNLSVMYNHVTFYIFTKMTDQLKDDFILKLDLCKENLKMLIELKHLKLIG